MTCTVCGTAKETKIKRVLAAIRERPEGRITVDFEKSTGTHLCGSCWASSNMKALHDRIAKREGKAALRRRLAKPFADWREQRPAEFAAVRDRALAAAHAKKIGSKVNRTPREQARASLSRLSLDPKGTFSLCRLCDRLMLTLPNAIARYPSAGQFHAVCVNKWRRTMHRPFTDLPPSGGQRGRGRSDTDIRQSYVATVLYFRQQEGSHGAARTDDGEVKSLAALANDLGIPRQQLYRRVQRFLSLLPEQAIASPAVRILCTVFGTLSGGPEDAPEKT